LIDAVVENLPETLRKYLLNNQQYNVMNKTFTFNKTSIIVGALPQFTHIAYSQIINLLSSQWMVSETREYQICQKHVCVEFANGRECTSLNRGQIKWIVGMDSAVSLH